MLRRISVSSAVVGAKALRACAATAACCSTSFALTLASARVASLRACASQAQQQQSAVDVENWTLNAEIVARHQRVQAKWVELGERFASLAAAKDYAGVLAAVDEGFALMHEVGLDDSPVHCPVMLNMTRAQAHYNLGGFDAALQSAAEAKAYFDRRSAAGKKGASAAAAADEARVREIGEFMGFVQLQRGDYRAALAIFDEMLQWVAVGSRNSLPMVQVAAQNMKRTLQTGRGRALYGIAVHGGGEEDKRQLLDAALDVIVESLSAHVDEKDVPSARMALDTATLCYCALGDTDKATEACDKLESWCTRHSDAEGLALVASRRAEIAALK